MRLRPSLVFPIVHNQLPVDGEPGSVVRCRTKGILARLINGDEAFPANVVIRSALRTGHVTRSFTIIHGWLNAHEIRLGIRPRDGFACVVLTNKTRLGLAAFTATALRPITTRAANLFRVDTVISFLLFHPTLTRKESAPGFCQFLTIICF